MRLQGCVVYIFVLGVGLGAFCFEYIHTCILFIDIVHSFLYYGFFSLMLLQIVFANFSSASIRFNFHIVIWVMG